MQEATSTEKRNSLNPDSPSYQQVMDLAMKTASEMMKQREGEMFRMFQAILAEARNQSQPNHARLPPLEQGLLRGLTEMKEYDGEGTRIWDDFQQEFVNKAAMITSLPKSEWVKYIHSRVKGQALNYARSTKPPLQNMDGALLTTDFELYCSTMRSAMFGAAKSNSALVHELITVKQEGKLADPAAFLKEKERLLNKLPPDCMAGWLKASLVLLGMNPLLVAALSPNPHSKDGQYHSYEELRTAVIATVGLNQSLLPNPAADKPVWQKQSYKTTNNGAGSPRFGPYNKNHSNKAPQQGKQQSNTGNADQAGPSGTKQVIGKWPEVVCSDCGIAGHRSKGFKSCPKHQPSDQFQKDNKGKAKS